MSLNNYKCPHCEGKGKSSLVCCAMNIGVFPPPPLPLIWFFLRRRLKKNPVRCCVCDGKGYLSKEDEHGTETDKQES